MSLTQLQAKSQGLTGKTENLTVILLFELADLLLMKTSLQLLASSYSPADSCINRALCGKSMKLGTQVYHPKT